MKKTLTAAALLITAAVAAQQQPVYADVQLALNPASSKGWGGSLDIGWHTPITPISIEANYLYMGSHAVGGSVGIDLRERHEWEGRDTKSTAWRLYAGALMIGEEEKTHANKAQYSSYGTLGVKGAIQFICFGFTYGYNSNKNQFVTLNLGVCIVDMIHHLKN
jgi:hypothetical protein